MENTYNYTKFTNVSRVKYAVYPLYLTGNIADSTAIHRKPRKKYRPGCLYCISQKAKKKIPPWDIVHRTGKSDQVSPACIEYIDG